MPEITTLFFDIGGVLLTNGWDTRSRRATIGQCSLDWEEFEDRHQFVAADFEVDKLTLDQYLDRTVFFRERSFDRDTFFGHMTAQSQALPESLELLADLSATDRYLLATLNNESRALNEYRIHHFDLDAHFKLFLSSCYLGLKKPEPEIYAMAIDVTGSRPHECLFIDDRALNLECAGRAGMQTVQFESATQLRRALGERGVAL